MLSAAALSHLLNEHRTPQKCENATLAWVRDADLLLLLHQGFMYEYHTFKNDVLAVIRWYCWKACYRSSALQLVAEYTPGTGYVQSIKV